MNQEETKDKKLSYLWLILAAILFFFANGQVPKKGNLMKRNRHKGTKTQSPPAGGPYKTPRSLLPAPRSLLPAPRSLLPAPCSTLPAPCSTPFNPLCLRVLVAKKQGVRNEIKS